MLKSKKTREELENEIAELERQLSKFEEHFDDAFEWQLEFPQLCTDSGDFEGFDIVIGNPPYIKEYDSRKSFDGLRNLAAYQGKMDLWYLFGVRGIELLKPDGYLCYIAPNNWTTNAGASKFRDFMIQNSQILQLVDFGSYFVFNTSAIQTMVMLFQKNQTTDNYSFDYRQVIDKNPSHDVILKALDKVAIPEINYLTPSIVRAELLDKTIHFANSQIDAVLENIKNVANFTFIEKSNSLPKLNEVANGIHPHHDKVSRAMLHKTSKNLNVGDGIFVLTEEEKNKIPFTKKELSLIVPNYTSRELKRYYANPKNKLWLIYTDSKFKNQDKILDYPNIKQHLDKYIEVITSDNKPYGLHRSRESHLFKGKKILSLRKCERPTFSYCDFDCYVLAEYYIIQTSRINLKYLTGILNSKLMEFWLRYRGKMQGNNFQVDKEPIMNLPIVNVSNQYTKKIITNVDKILIAKEKNPESDISKMESEINLCTYKIYGLKYDEVKIIDTELTLSVQAYEQD